MNKKHGKILSGLALLRQIAAQRQLLPGLFVVGIVMLLVIALRHTRGKANQRQCMTNLMQIGHALALYADDYDHYWPSTTQAPAIAGGVIGGTETPVVPYTSQLAPFLTDDSVYACPEDDVLRQEGELWDGRYKTKLLKRSYALTGAIITLGSAEAAGPDASLNAWEFMQRAQKMSDPNTGIIGRRTDAVDIPALTIEVVENWGYLDSVLEGPLSNAILGESFHDVLKGCDTAELPGRHVPPVAATDRFAPCISRYNDTHRVPARGHAGSGNYLMADGHAALLRWDQVREEDFRRFKLQQR